MTRKDYIAIAEALRRSRQEAERDHAQAAVLKQWGVINAAEYIAYAMQDDNPRFDREHFLAVVRGERELGSRPKRSTVAQSRQLRSWGVPASK